MKRVVFSGNGQGAVARELQHLLTERGDTLVFEEDMSTGCDVAICTTGAMRIEHAQLVSHAQLEYLHEGNYLIPRAFIERAAASMPFGGLIIVLGSNAGTYGNVGAEDYAAYKAALKKYCEIRRRTLRDDGIRVSYIGFGGIDTPFWSKATKDADPELCKTIVPGERTPLTVQDAAAYILSLIDLPANVAVSDSLVLSVKYQ